MLGVYQRRCDDWLLEYRRLDDGGWWLGHDPLPVGLVLQLQPQLALDTERTAERRPPVTTPPALDSTAQAQSDNLTPHPNVEPPPGLGPEAAGREGVEEGEEAEGEVETAGPL